MLNQNGADFRYMKKLLVLLFLVALGTGAYAQKSYVNVFADIYYKDAHQIRLSGDVPFQMKKIYDSSDKVLIGDILNMLSSEGFEVEFMSNVGFSSTGMGREMNYLLSKPSSTPSHIIQTEKADDDSEVHEVARYNLQGMPIGKNEKGVQIVVYSNYTTKTIIVE